MNCQQPRHKSGLLCVKYSFWYYEAMRRLNITVLLFEPSFFSGTVTVIGAFTVLVLANFSYLLRSGLIFDVLYGKDSPVDLIQTSRDTASSINQTIFGNHTLNQILFFAFWMMIGLFAYVTIMAISQSVSETETDVKTLGYVHARKALVERSMLVRIAIRLGAILGGGIYIWVFIRFLLPFSVYSSRVGLGNLSDVSGWVYLLIGFVVLALSMHLCVIIARLVMVRPRVFGSWDSLLLDTK